MDSAYKQKERFFDEAAPEWENRGFDDNTRAFVQRILEEARVAEGTHVLEPGCGAGRLTSLLADTVGTEGKVVAADISGRMAECARRNVQRDNVCVIHSPAEHVKLPPDSVDVVLCFDVFPHFEEHHRVLHAFKKFLRPDGRLVVAHCRGRKDVNDLHTSVGCAVAEDHLPDNDQMRELLQNCGFRVDRLDDQEENYLLLASPAGTD